MKRLADIAGRCIWSYASTVGTQVGADGPQTRDISLPWNNTQIDAARRTFLDRHPLAKNKEQVALAKGEGKRMPLV